MFKKGISVIKNLLGYLGLIKKLYYNRQNFAINVINLVPIFKSLLILSFSIANRRLSVIDFSLNLSFLIAFLTTYTTSIY